MEIKNLTKAAKRIAKAASEKEPIILYGDADLDGVCSVVILQETLKSLGANVVKLYFPDREKDGYGITRAALQELAEFSPALLVVMDLGISNFEEIKLARKNGFEVILVDHHEILDKLPEADIIVDPKQPRETYKFHEFAACGLTFRLALKLLGKNVSPVLRKNLVELAALGTIADMMPRKEDNVEIIREGVEEFPDSWRPGIQAFFALPEFTQFRQLETMITQIISVLNVRDVEDGYPASFRVLTSLSKERASFLIKHLWEKNKVRKEQIRIFAERVRQHARASSVVFYGEPLFDYILLGSVASIVSQEYQKPAFIYKQKETESIGSVRAPGGYDTVEAMKTCAPLLITYGGHPQASGFRVLNKNLEAFQKRIEAYFTEKK